MRSKVQVWLTIISLILAVVVGAVQLWDWVDSPDPDLVAEIEYGPFTYPPGLEDSLSSGVPEPFSHIRGYWSIIVRNEGKKLAKSVRLRLGDLVYVCIYQDNKELVNAESTQWIKIGDLHPLEGVRIVAWSSSIPSIYIYLHREFISDEIRLTHESGVGTVVIRAPIDPFWHEVASFWEILWSIIQFLIIVVLISVSIVWIVAKLEERKRSQPNPSESQSKPDPK